MSSSTKVTPQDGENSQYSASTELSEIACPEIIAPATLLYSQALRSRHDALKSIDVIDTAFYLGVKVTPERVCKILEELILEEEEEERQGKDEREGKDTIVTRATFWNMEPADIMTTVMLHKRIITKGSLPRLRHIAERFLLNLLGIW